VSYPETGKILMADWDIIKKLLVKLILTEEVDVVEESSRTLNTSGHIHQAPIGLVLDLHQVSSSSIQNTYVSISQDSTSGEAS